MSKDRHQSIPAPLADFNPDGGRRDVQYTMMPQSPVKVPKEELSFFERWKSGQFTISPEDNPIIDIWDMIVIIALFGTAVVLPFEVALVLEAPRPLYVCNKVIDAVFACDILLTFNVAYTVNTPMSRDSYERAPLKIARNYMAMPFSNRLTSGWFWPDTLTVMPWEVVLPSNDVADEGKSLRLVRVLRLVRMFRLVRVIKLFKRWHTHFGFSFAMVEVTKCLCITLLTLHWLACAWGYVAISSDEDQVSWLVWAGHKKGLEVLSVFEIYNMALYYATSTLTTVGFGDVLPQNHGEVGMTTVTMLFTGFLWSWFVASIVNVITNMDVYATRFHQLMDELNLLMESRGLQQTLRWRLRKHLHESFYVHRNRHQQETIKWLSMGLQGEIAIQSGVDKVCDCVWYLRGLDEGVLIDIAQRFFSDMFSPNEYMLDRCSLSVIRKGACIKRGKILTRDSAIGEDMILETEILREFATPRTLTFLETMTLKRCDLQAVCQEHSGFSQRMRLAQVKLAMFRGFIYASKKLLKEEEERKLLAEGSKPPSRRASVSEKNWDKIFAQEDDEQPQSRFLRASLDGSGKTGQDSADVSEVLSELRNLRRKVDESHVETVGNIRALEGRLDSFERRPRLGGAGPMPGFHSDSQQRLWPT